VLPRECVAACCSLLQCEKCTHDSLICRVLQCVAVLQRECIALFCSALQERPGNVLSVLQRVAVCRSMLQCIAVRCRRDLEHIQTRETSEVVATVRFNCRRHTCLALLCV